MKKRRIVIASVLKPIDDTRMYEKMATTLCILDNDEVVVIGYPSNTKPAQTGISFLPHSPFKRIGLGRVLVPFKTLRKLTQLRPQLLIVNTYELLIVAIANRILFGTRILYDVRENYYRNILHTASLPSPIKWLMAPLVRLKEKLTAPFIHHFILAEGAYQKEMSFFRNRFTVLENRGIENMRSRFPGDRTKLLFTGTLAKSTGVFQVIALAKKLHLIDPTMTLTIAGYCAISQTRNEIKKACVENPFITVIGLDKLVPHEEIIDEIFKADFGVIYYPSSPSTINAIPTKLFEYMANQLPILTWPDQRFATLVEQHEAGLLINQPIEEVYQKMKKDQFYPRPIPDIHWEGEKFLSLIQGTLG